jgi:hypothetical protein
VKRPKRPTASLALSSGIRAPWSIPSYLPKAHRDLSDSLQAL